MKKQTTDKIKNAWRLRQGVMVFDIETENVKDWSEQGKKNAVFKCGVIYNYKDNRYYKFLTPEPLVKFLNTAKGIVSYNGEGFDFLVLQKHGLKIKKHKNRVHTTNIKSFDIMHTIHEKRPAKNKKMKYPSLEEMMKEHYKAEKQEYNRNNMDELMQHCMDDVKYTKMLYEEKVWQVPILPRKASKRVWEHRYDEDLVEDETGIIDDGVNVTYIADFGMPVESREIKPTDELKCPKCKKAKISLYEIARKKSNEAECPNCGAVATYSLSNELVSVKSKKEYAESICPNCKKQLEETSYLSHGYGAGAGYISSGRSKCPKCKKGCYEWSNDDIPGFRDSDIRPCCKCGK